MQFGWRDPTARFRNHGKFAPIEPAPEGEGLTGWVMGKEASDIEERLYRVVKEDSRVTRVLFRRVFGAPRRSMAGAIEVDFLVWAGRLIAIQVDANQWHKTAAQVSRDMKQDEALLRILRWQGVDRVQRVQGKYLANPDKAQRTWDQIMGGRTFTHWS